MECFRGCLLILSSLFLISVDICSAQDMEDLIAVTIPRAMESVSIQTVVETTECSVTCGLGSKVEKRCLVDRSGIHKDCEVVRVECLSSWLCGHQVSTLRVGDHFTMDCQMPPSGILGGNKIYYWKVAPGIISVNDNYFRPLKFWNSTIVFDSIQEKNAGTYRCDVQREDDLKLVKRIYFGIRIITPGIMDIDYDKYLISKQKLSALAEGLHAQDVLKKLEVYGGEYTYIGIGSAVGIVTGIVILVLIRCTCRSKEKDIDATSVL